MESVNSLDIRCALCELVLALYEPATDTHRPTPEELLQAGRVPVPNFGWFCSQECGNTYSERTGIKFDRDVSGNIRYY